MLSSTHNRPSRRRLGPLFGLTVLLLAGLSTTSCTTPEPWTADNPEIALRAFLEALEVRDYDTVWLFLPDSARERFTALAQEQAAALDQPLGEDENPLERVLLRIWSPSAFELDRLEQVSADDSRAVYLLHSIFGHRTSVEMIRTEGRWTIDLFSPSPSHSPSPPAPAGEGATP